MESVTSERVTTLWLIARQTSLNFRDVGIPKACRRQLLVNINILVTCPARDGFE
jgi:hypothetical protein